MRMTKKRKTQGSIHYIQLKVSNELYWKIKIAASEERTNPAKWITNLTADYLRFRDGKK